MIKIIKRTINNIKKEQFLSVSNILVMTITFLFLGTFITIITLTQTALKSLEDQAQITVFFKDEFSEDKILSLKDKFFADERISEITYISKEEAFRLFSEINKDDPTLLESISANILPASLEIKTKRIANLSLLAEEFSSVEGVETVRFFKDVIDSFKFWSTLAYVIGFVLVIVLMLISYSIILSTLRATIDSKGVELSILKLVGASDTYIRMPFVYQGTLFGLIASVVASIIFIILGGIATYFNVFSKGFSFGFIYGLYLSPIVYSLILSFILLLSGAALGYLGSNIAVKKYLKY